MCFDNNTGYVIIFMKVKVKATKINTYRNGNGTNGYHARMTTKTGKTISMVSVMMIVPFDLACIHTCFY